MPTRVIENSLPSVSSKFVLKGLLPEERIGDLKVSGILGDGSFLVIPMLPWCGSRKIKYGYHGQRGIYTTLLNSYCPKKYGKTLEFFLYS